MMPKGGLLLLLSALVALAHGAEIPASFEQSVEVLSGQTGMVFRWNVLDEETIEGLVEVQASSTNRWVAVGLGNWMVDSRTLIGMEPEISVVQIAAKSPAGVAYRSTELAGLTEVSFVPGETVTKLYFVGKAILDSSFDVNGSNGMVFATGPRQGTTVQSHYATKKKMSVTWCPDGCDFGGAQETETSDPTAAPSTGPSVSPSFSPSAAPSSSPTMADDPVPEVILGGSQTLFGGKGSVEWKQIEEGSNDVSISMEADGNNWIAFGFGTKMSGSKVVICQPGVGMQEYDITARNGAGVKAFAGDSVLDAGMCEFSAGKTKMNFTTQAVSGVAFAPSLGGAQDVVAVYGSASTLGYHGSSTEHSALFTLQWNDLSAPDDNGDSVVPTASPTSAPTVNETVVVGGSRVLFKGFGNLEWVVEEDGSVTMEMRVEKPNVWVAFGFGERMTGSRVVAGTPGDGQVREYSITAKSSSGVQVSSEPSVLRDVSLETVGGATIMKFTSKAIVGRQINVDDLDSVLAVYGNGPNMGYHGDSSEHSEVFQVQWKTGSSNGSGNGSGVNKTAVIIAHGAIMLAAFAFLMPLFTGASVLRGMFKKDDTWFLFHRGGQSFTVILMFVGFILAIVSQDTHFDNAHKQLGLAIIIIALIQPILAVFLRKKYRGPWKVQHFLTGIFIFVASWANCYLGWELIDDYLANDQTYLVFTVFLGLGAVFTFVITIMVMVNRIPRHSKQSPPVKTDGNNNDASESASQTFHSETAKSNQDESSKQHQEITQV